MANNVFIRLFKTVFVTGINLSALCALIYFSGCCWKTPEDKSYRLEVTQKNLFSYANNQEITFEDDNGAKFPVTVNKQVEIIKLAMFDSECVECCTYYETLELEIVEFTPEGLDNIFPVLVAAPLKSTPYRSKDGAYELRVITADALEYLKSGSGNPIITEQALSFDDDRKMRCIYNEPFRVCHSNFDRRGTIYENVAEVKLIKIHHTGFSFVQCFFTSTGLLGIRQTQYENDLPVDTLNYFRVD
jgi:hypothetical protein